MSIDGDDINTAAATIAKSVSMGLVGYREGESHMDHGESFSVAGGLFAVATAINRLADVIEAGQSE